ncbi:MAG: hypothetical protein R2834_11670 [Rhodothermales bacterium]
MTTYVVLKVFEMLNALIVNNGIFGLEKVFPSTDTMACRFVETGPDFNLDLAGVDLLIVPNGSDHVAMHRAKQTVRAFLDAGGTLLCFDGWFTDWVPGNRWIHDNSKATRDIRYAIDVDRHGLFDGVAFDDLQFNHGISGWWACGYIEAAPGADVLMRDTWGRPMIVLDETTTAGRMLLTASGPLGEYGTDGELAGLTALYRNALKWAKS